MKDNKIEWSVTIFPTLVVLGLMFVTDLSYWAYLGIFIFFYFASVIGHEENKKEAAEKELIQQALRYYSNNNK